jgi:hypothetical protein
MTWSWENLDAGYMLSTLVDPWLLYPVITALKGPRYPLTYHAGADRPVGSQQARMVRRRARGR